MIKKTLLLALVFTISSGSQADWLGPAISGFLTGWEHAEETKSAYKKPASDNNYNTDQKPAGFNNYNTDWNNYNTDWYNSDWKSKSKYKEDGIYKYYSDDERNPAGFVNYDLLMDVDKNPADSGYKAETIENVFGWQGKAKGAPTDEERDAIVERKDAENKNRIYVRGVVNYDTKRESLEKTNKSTSSIGINDFLNNFNNKESARSVVPVIYNYGDVGQSLQFDEMSGRFDELQKQQQKALRRQSQEMKKALEKQTRDIQRQRQQYDLINNWKPLNKYKYTPPKARPVYSY
jgi:hypothetical protein